MIDAEPTTTLTWDRRPISGRCDRSPCRRRARQLMIGYAHGDTPETWRAVIALVCDRHTDAAKLEEYIVGHIDPADAAATAEDAP